MIGYCKFCGQGMETPTDARETADSFATANCTCAGSRNAQRKARLRETVREMGDERDWTDRQQALVALMGEMALEDELETGSLVIEGEKVGVRLLNNGNLKISVRTTREKNVEVGG